MAGQGKRYKTAQWQRYREFILLRDLYTCQMCGVILTGGKGNGRSAVVDHIKPAALRPDLFYAESNTRAVCKRCHDTVCAHIEAKHTGDADAIGAAKRAYRPVGLDGYPA